MPKGCLKSHSRLTLNSNRVIECKKGDRSPPMAMMT